MYVLVYLNVIVCIDDLIKWNVYIFLKLFLLKLGFKLFKLIDDKLWYIK